MVRVSRTTSRHYISEKSDNPGFYSIDRIHGILVLGMSKKLLEYLVKDPYNYRYSSVRYYEMKKKFWIFERFPGRVLKRLVRETRTKA